MSHKPPTYHPDNTQIHKLFEFAGERMESFTHENLWDLITVLSAELSLTHPKDGHDVGLVRMDETRKSLKMSWDAVTEHSLEILDGISRRDAKLLLMGLTSIAAYSDTH
ncbi:MAG: hypothetical protein ACRC62_26075 [Microcoleus sp.]